MIKHIATGYHPRVHQQYIHANFKRFNVIACHRRFGKTVMTLNELVDRALRQERKNPQYAYIAPTYGQAKRVAWDYFKEYTKNIPGVSYNESELRVEIARPGRGDKIKIWLLGAENPDAIRGIYLDGVVLDEFAEMNPIVWTSVVRAALSDRLGWAIFIGTVKGQNHFYDVYHQALDNEEWFAAMFKASETKIIPESELESARAGMSEEEYLQEFECDWGAALVGAYYGKHMSALEKDDRLCKVVYDPAVAVETWWDLGIGDTTAIWFTQQVGPSYHVIDYVEMSGVGLDWYVKELKKKQYVYGDVNLPHDAAARDLSTGKTRVETFRGLWPSARVNIIPKQSVEDGINAVRMVLPKCYFDRVNCERGISALRSYQKKWDGKNKIYMDKPLHDWASNGADAFRMFALGNRYDRPDRMNRNLPRQSVSSFDVLA